MEYDVKKVNIQEIYPDPEESKYKKQGITNMNALLKTALTDKRIGHMQFNFQDKDVLRDAQKHPENYPTLMVRVAGYSVYFTDLHPDVQNDVISRTEHTF